MMRPPMSPAAASLLRGLLARSSVARDRILLTEYRSTDWQSLVFVGERHVFRLRIPGPEAVAIAARLTAQLEDCEWRIPGQLVADITLDGAPAEDGDGSISLTIEALTIAE